MVHVLHTIEIGSQPHSANAPYATHVLSEILLDVQPAPV